MKKKSLLLYLYLSVVWLVVSGGPSWGQGTPSVGPQWESVLVVTKTFTASRDNTLFEYAGVDLSNGAGPAFFAGRTKQPQGSIRRGLIFFDLTDSGIPPNALVTQVTLQLHLSDSNIGPQNVTLHRLVADWGEGNSFSQGAGAVPTAGDATWRHTFFDTAFWTTPGRGFLLYRQRRCLYWRYRLLFLVIHPDGVGRSRVVNHAGSQLWLDTAGKRNSGRKRQTF